MPKRDNSSISDFSNAFGGLLLISHVSSLTKMKKSRYNLEATLNDDDMLSKGEKKECMAGKDGSDSNSAVTDMESIEFQEEFFDGYGFVDIEVESTVNTLGKSLSTTSLMDQNSYESNLSDMKSEFFLEPEHAPGSMKRTMTVSSIGQGDENPELVDMRELAAQGLTIVQEECECENTTSTRTFEESVGGVGCFDRISLTVKGYRLVRDESGHMFAQFHIVVVIDDQSESHIWRRHSDLATLAKHAQERQTTHNDMERACLAWDAVEQVWSIFWNLNHEHLSDKTMKISMFLREFLFEMHSCHNLLSCLEGCIDST